MKVFVRGIVTGCVSFIFLSVVRVAGWVIAFFIHRWFQFGNEEFIPFMQACALDLNQISVLIWFIFAMVFGMYLSYVGRAK